MDNLYLAGNPLLLVGDMIVISGISCRKQTNALYAGIWVGIST